MTADLTHFMVRLLNFMSVNALRDFFLPRQASLKGVGLLVHHFCSRRNDDSLMGWV